MLCDSEGKGAKDASFFVISPFVVNPLEHIVSTCFTAIEWKMIYQCG